jgi:hypothetical protein
LFDNLESERRRICSEDEMEPVGTGCGAVLDCEVQALAVATQIEIGIAPSVQLGGSPERLTTALMRGTLTGMMHESDGGMVVALQRAQIGEQRCNLAGEVLIDGVQAHERVEDQQRRTQLRNSGAQRLAVFGAIEPEGWHGDDVDVEGLEVDAGGLQMP